MCIWDWSNWHFRSQTIRQSVWTHVQLVHKITGQCPNISFHVWKQFKNHFQIGYFIISWPCTLATCCEMRNALLYRQRRRGSRKTFQSWPGRRISSSWGWGLTRPRAHSWLRHSRKLSGRWVVSDICWILNLAAYKAIEYSNLEWSSSITRGKNHFVSCFRENTNPSLKNHTSMPFYIRGITFSLQKKISCFAITTALFTHINIYIKLSVIKCRCARRQERSHCWSCSWETAKQTSTSDWTT